QTAVTVASPYVKPLYDTRAVEKTLADLARKMEIAYQAVTPKDIVLPLLSGDTTYEDIVRQGGVWLEGKSPETKSEADSESPAHLRAGTFELTAATFAGDVNQYPMQFQPYLSLQFHDGRDSQLPWMQELP